MKKVVLLSMITALVLSFTGCADKDNTPADDATTSIEVSSSEETGTEKEEPSSPEVSSEESTSESTVVDSEDVAVMTYAEYIAAEVDTPVVIEAYVQAKQSWWEDKATVYTQDENGAYFIYNMACSKDDYALLVPGTKIRVSGYKGVWAGEVEVAEGATFEIIDGSFIATALDVTDLLGSDELIQHQNELVSFKGMTVEAAGQDDAGNDVAFLYNWDGSGEDGNDLYFKVSKDGETYTFTVESYLCDKTTEVYAAVKNLTIGQTIDMEGFLYWYEGANPHITSVTVVE